MTLEQLEALRQGPCGEAFKKWSVPNAMRLYEWEEFAAGWFALLDYLTSILDRLVDAQKGDWIAADVDLVAFLSSSALARLWDVAVERGKREAREEIGAEARAVDDKNDSKDDAEFVRKLAAYGVGK